ncbi:hypothetical protein G6Z94_11665 [Vibrio aestuarianus]|uniref:hypothetical protein n=1 Tax=Vibrio aestuarianus TaxID=28171 RepID=UPI0015945D3A|nr:hypothetical protein [Vibrio aestuarianus]NGZ17996.1 hypothetical protein [Vibrio aestuarianus]
MSNKNIVLMLHENLDKATGQSIYPADIAHLLGYGATQIKQYFKWAREGEIQKPNDRLERAASFAYRLGELEGFESLFPYIPKLSGNLDNAEYMVRTGRRMDKMMRADRSIEGQLDLIKDTNEAETDDQTTAFYGSVSPLSVAQIYSDVINGHISEEYGKLICQLHHMFGEQEEGYAFAEVKAALVALECPDMVEASKDEPKWLGDVRHWCDLYLSDACPDKDIRHLIALKVATAAEELKVKKFQLAAFVCDLAQFDELGKLTNIRLVRKALRESDVTTLTAKSKAETGDQTSDIQWPLFVGLDIQDTLKDYDAEKLKWAFSLKGPRVIMRVLEGYVKEVKNG